MPPVDPADTLCSLNDASGCMAAYEQVRRSVEGGLRELPVSVTLSLPCPAHSFARQDLRLTQCCPLSPRALGVGPSPLGPSACYFANTSMMYRQVRRSVEGGLRELLAEREADPERDLLPRLAGQAARFLPAFDLVAGR